MRKHGAGRHPGFGLLIPVFLSALSHHRGRVPLPPSHRSKRPKHPSLPLVHRNHVPRCWPAHKTTGFMRQTRSSGSEWSATEFSEYKSQVSGSKRCWRSASVSIGLIVRRACSSKPQTGRGPGSGRELLACFGCPAYQQKLREGTKVYAAPGSRRGRSGLGYCYRGLHN
jgi:hypothetical protein